jgi:hypothetical protein
MIAARGGRQKEGKRQNAKGKRAEAGGRGRVPITFFPGKK